MACFNPSGGAQRLIQHQPFKRFLEGQIGTFPPRYRSTDMSNVYARLGAVAYAAWGLFHVYVAWQIYSLGLSEQGIAQGRLLQLAVYMLTIALFAVFIAVTRNWRNDALGYKLNLGVVSWADTVWVLVVVLPGYVPLARGLIPPAIWITGAVLTSIGQRKKPTSASYAGAR